MDQWTAGVRVSSPFPPADQRHGRAKIRCVPRIVFEYLFVSCWYLVCIFGCILFVSCLYLWTCDVNSFDESVTICGRPCVSQCLCCAEYLRVSSSIFEYLFCYLGPVTWAVLMSRVWWLTQRVAVSALLGVSSSIFEYLSVSLSIFLYLWTGDMSRFDESFEFRGRPRVSQCLRHSEFSSIFEYLSWRLRVSNAIPRNLISESLGIDLSRSFSFIGDNNIQRGSHLFGTPLEYHGAICHFLDYWLWFAANGCAPQRYLA